MQNAAGAQQCSKVDRDIWRLKLC